MSEHDPTSQLPNHTTPTWEVELLISGIAVFAMLQLPGWLDDQAFALLPRFGADWAEPGKLIYIYAKSAAVILALTFSVHLLLRAHWIALVGMYSVYPDGIRWDRLRMGPIQRSVEQRLYGNAHDTIDGADNRATVVFALGVMFASILIMISIGIFLAYGIAITVMHRLDLHLDAARVFLACISILLLPFFFATLVDRQLGERLAPDGLPARVVDAMLRLYAKLGLGRWSTPLRLMASHASERKLMLVTMLVMGSVTSATILAYKVLVQPERMGDYALFPGVGGATISAAHYDDQRNPARDAAVPYVQGMVVNGPYLRLVVPYDPLRDATALRDHCHTAEESEETRSAVRMGCLATARALSLDGKPVADPAYMSSGDPRTDRPALLAMIDIRGLTQGPHELRIARSPREANQDDGDDPGFDAIRFWK